MRGPRCKRKVSGRPLSRGWMATLTATVLTVEQWSYPVTGSVPDARDHKMSETCPPLGKGTV